MQDFNLAPDENYNSPTISRDDEFIHQQIDILFDTTPGDLQGASDFGTTYDELLYEEHLSTSQLERTMKADLSMLDLRGFGIDVLATILPGTLRDIALIEVNLNRNNYETKKVYKIE
nr:MAG TPA: hypothetical protein [Caudoviricetes sp.]